MRGIKWTAVLLMGVLIAGCNANAPKKSNDKSQAYEAYTRLGFQYLQTGSLLDAKTFFQRALELNSNHAEAHNGLALAFQLEGDDDLSEEYFRRATRLAPDSAMMHNNFGAFLFAKKRYKEACVELSRATEDPFYQSRAQAFENLGRCYRHISRDAAARHAFERSLQISPNRVVALIELAELHLAVGEVNAAESYFDRFVELVEARQVEHYPKSLWVGIQLAREKRNSVKSATYALLLKNLYPESDEYRAYKESSR